MNISKNSKENESLIIKSKTLKNSIKLKPSLNTKFFSIATHASTCTFTNQANMESKRYRKTISYLRSPSFVDLVNQTNLVDNKVIKFNKNYLINLIKIKMKKNKSKLPTIQTLSTFSPNTEVNFRTFSIDFNNMKKTNNYQFHQTFNNSTRNKNKKKINELYKKIYSKKNNLKNVYVNQFMISNNKKKDDKETLNMSIKPKMMNNINPNLMKSQKKFMKYHGFNKRNKFSFKLNMYGKKKDKYPNVDNIQILQLFLKKKLKIINKQMDDVKDQCETAKNNLIHVYDSFNEQIQKNIGDVYDNDQV